MRHSKSALFTGVRILTGVGLLVYLSFSGSINWSAVTGLASFWTASLSALCLLLVMVGLTSWRLCLLLRPQGLHLSLASSIRLTLIGAYFNLILPGATGGDVVRIYYAMKGNHGRRTEIATVMLLDRLFGTFALVSLPLLIAPLFPELLQSMKLLRVLLWSSAAGFIAMSTGIIICFWARATESSLLLRTIEKLPLGEYIKRIYDTICAYRQNLGTLMGVVAISILVHTLLITVMLLLVSVTSADGASREMAVLFPFGFLANSLPITPGGLGVGEIAFGKLFDLAGLTGGVEALLGWRMLTLVIDLLGLFFYLQGRHELLSYQAQPGIPPVLER